MAEQIPVRQPGTFYPGDPRCGRKRGSLGKATRDVRAIARKFVENKNYRENLRRRIFAGDAELMERELWWYAYGKPKERIEITEIDVTALDIVLVESRLDKNGKSSNGSEGNGHGGNGSAVIDVEPSNDDPPKG